MSEVTKITTSNAKIYVEGKSEDILKNIRRDEEGILAAKLYREFRAAEWLELKKLEPASTISPYNGYFYRRETVRIKSTAIQCLESMGDCDVR